jgi:hypothetical protein
MPTTILFDVAGPGTIALLAGGSILALCIFTILIALVEAVALTLLRWGAFKRSGLVALVMNIVSSIVGGTLLVLMPTQSLLWIILSFVLSVLIEGGILMLFKRGAARQNWTAALVANLASYIILIAPAYYFGQR